VVFLVVEQKEPHAGRMAFATVEQPTTFAERLTLARRIRDELEVPLPIFVDGMDDASRALFSDLPSPAFVIDRLGRIADKLPWTDPEALQKSLSGIIAEDPIPASKDGSLTLEERDAIARRLIARGNGAEALGWLDAGSDRAPSTPPSLAAMARAAITRVLAADGAPATQRAAMDAAQKALLAAWSGDPARLTAARIELAEAGSSTEQAGLWRSALAGLDDRAPAAVREWLARRNGTAK